MRVCIVGQGPSAEGRGTEIDACDIVVRMKEFWNCGASDAGEKTDVVAYYGGSAACAQEYGKEHWMTHNPARLIKLETMGRRRIETFVNWANGRPIVWLDDDYWQRMHDYLNRDPSTGFVACGMAIRRYPGCRLVLYGFDSTTVDRPNYWDAQQLAKKKVAHCVMAEKLAIAEIFKGRWLGEKTAVTLNWPDMPELDSSKWE